MVPAICRIWSMVGLGRLDKLKLFRLMPAIRSCLYTVSHGAGQPGIELWNAVGMMMGSWMERSPGGSRKLLTEPAYSNIGVAAKYMPLKPRRTVLPLPAGSHAKPRRGANCFNWLGISPGFSEMPLGNTNPFTRGTMALLATGVGFKTPSQRRP